MALAGVRIAVERGVRHGAVLAMVVAEAHTHVDLGGIADFPAGEDAIDYLHLLSGHEETAELVLALAPADQILAGDS